MTNQEYTRAMHADLQLAQRPPMPECVLRAATTLDSISVAFQRSLPHVSKLAGERADELLRHFGKVEAR